MGDRYIQYRILYTLYVKNYDGLLNGIDIKSLLNEGDLQFIDKGIISGELWYLHDQRLISIEQNTIKIKGKGIDIIDRILQKYYELLEGNREAGLEDSHNNISLMPNLFEMRKTTHFFIKKRSDLFKKFLISSSIFEKLISPAIMQVYNPIDKSIHIEYVKNLDIL